MQAELAVTAPAVDPLRGTRPGDPHLGGHVGDRPALAAPDKAQATFIGQRGITVRHEGRSLSLAEDEPAWMLIFAAEGLPSLLPQPHWPVVNGLPRNSYRFLLDEAADAGEQMSPRTAWWICSSNSRWSTFGKPKRGKRGRPGPPVHDAHVQRDFTADRAESAAVG